MPKASTNRPSLPSFRQIFFPVLLPIIFFLTLIMGYFFTTFSIKDDILDSDAFYHFAISKIMVDQGGIIRSLPQVEDLGWKDHFVDKEFLFHIATAVAYFINGEEGMKILTIIIGILFISLIFHLIYRETNSPLGAFLIALLLISPYPFLHRLTMMRPQILSMLIYIIFLYALLRNRPRILLIACFLHPLSYHTFYFIPFNLFLAFFILGPGHAKLLLKGLGLLILGILVNPYFPENIFISWAHLKTALFMTGLGKGYTPMELHVPSWDRIWSIHLMFLIIFFINALNFKQLWEDWRKQTGQAGQAGHKIHFILALTLLFYILLMFNYRMIEYSIPVLTLLWGYSYLAFPHHKKLIIISLILLNLANFGLISRNNPKEGYEALMSYLKNKVNKAFDVLPLPTAENGEANKKMCNCSWTTGNNTLYKRPNLRFVDLLDPSLLYHKNPGLYEARESLMQGEMIDPWSVIKEQCGGDYFSCQTGPILFQLELDPRFERLFPEESEFVNSINLQTGFIDNTQELAIYRLNPKVNELFVSTFLAGLAGQNKDKATTTITANKNFRIIVSTQLTSETKTEIETELIVPSEEVHKHLGATTLILGGNWPLKIFMNGQEIKAQNENENEGESGNVGQALFKDRYQLFHPLKSGDQLLLKILSFAGNDTGLNFFALSLWTDNDIQQVCSEKKFFDPRLRNAIFLKWLRQRYPSFSLLFCPQFI